MTNFYNPTVTIMTADQFLDSFDLDNSYNVREASNKKTIKKLIKQIRVAPEDFLVHNQGVYVFRLKGTATKKRFILNGGHTVKAFIEAASDPSLKLNLEKTRVVVHTVDTTDYLALNKAAASLNSASKVSPIDLYNAEGTFTYAVDKLAQSGIKVVRRSGEEIASDAIPIHNIIRTGYGQIWGSSTLQLMNQVAPQGVLDVERFIYVATMLYRLGLTGKRKPTVEMWAAVNLPQLNLGLVKGVYGGRDLTEIFKDSSIVEEIASTTMDMRYIPTHMGEANNG